MLSVFRGKYFTTKEVVMDELGRKPRKLDIVLKLK